MQLHNSSNYTNERNTSLKLVEGERLYAYVDTSGIPTIGIGLNLRTHQALVLHALGFDVARTQLTGAALQAELNYMDRFVNPDNAANRATNTVGLFYQAGYPSNNTESNQALAAFNAILRERAANPVYANAQNFISTEAFTAFHSSQSFQNQTFRLPSTTVSEDLLTNVIDGYTNPITGLFVAGYEATLDLWLNSTGVGVAQPGLLVHDNKERLALFSLTFNSRQFTTNQANTTWDDIGLPTLLGKRLTTALLNDNRAEAWFEIRYNSNFDGQHASRR